jgi:hypothetical protein
LNISTCNKKKENKNEIYEEKMMNMRKENKERT